jgi:hypothetical protein
MIDDEMNDEMNGEMSYTKRGNILPSTSRIIYNFREKQYELSSAEYIPKKRSDINLNITMTHGIGSGLYGVTKYEERPGPEYIVTELILNNPLIIDNPTLDGYLTDISIWMIELVQLTINKGKDVNRLKIAKNDNNGTLETEIQRKIDTDTSRINILKNTDYVNDIIDKTYRLFSKTTTEERPDESNRLIIKSKLFGAINGFIKDYSSANEGDFLLQPINYLLQKEGYDGEYNSSETGDTFSRGSIAFVTINPRNQQRAFGGINYLPSRNNLVYNGSDTSGSDIKLEYLKENLEDIQTSPEIREFFLKRATADIKERKRSYTPRSSTNLVKKFTARKKWDDTMRPVMGALRARKERSKTNKNVSFAVTNIKGGGSKKKRGCQTKKRNKKRITKKYKR